MRSLRIRIAAVLLVAMTCTSCATNHLLNWSRGDRSMYSQPTDKRSPFVRPAGTVLVLPVAFVWDVVTLPFQWLWDVYPYGESLSPETYDPEPDSKY